jgi:CHAD domain-containing protein
MKNPSVIELQKYAALEAGERIRRLAYEINRAAKRADEETIHDLRVSTRRLSQCLLAFGDLFPRRASKKAGRRMGKIMKRSAEVRNRDIAMGLLEESGIDEIEDVIDALTKERKQAVAALSADLKGLKEKEISRRWTTKLKAG